MTLTSCFIQDCYSKIRRYLSDWSSTYRCSNGAHASPATHSRYLEDHRSRVAFYQLHHKYCITCLFKKGVHEKFVIALANGKIVVPYVSAHSSGEKEVSIIVMVISALLNITITAEPLKIKGTFRFTRQRLSSPQVIVAQIPLTMMIFVLTRVYCMHVY